MAVVAFALMPLLAPITALADDTATPTDTPAASDSPAPTDSPAATPSTGSLLGPSSVGSGSGGSTTDSTALQPAGLSPLQSTTGDASGLTAPNGSALQAPASSSDTLKVIMGDADGSPVQVADASNNPSAWNWLGLSVVFGLIVAVITLLYRRKPALFAPLTRLRIPRRHRK